MSYNSPEFDCEFTASRLFSFERMNRLTAGHLDELRMIENFLCHYFLFNDISCFIYLYEKAALYVSSKNFHASQ